MGGWVLYGKEYGGDQCCKGDGGGYFKKLKSQLLLRKD